MSGNKSSRLLSMEPGGKPVEVIARLSPTAGVLGHSGASQSGGVVLSRGRVSLVAPGATVARRDDELDVDAALGPEADVEQLGTRSVGPLVTSVVAGCSSALLVVGASRSDKAQVAFGALLGDGAPPGDGAGPSTSTAPPPNNNKSGAGHGIAHVAARELFVALRRKTDDVAKALRNAGSGPMGGGSSGSYSFYVEVSMTEVYNEKVRDLLCDPPEEGGGAGREDAVIGRGGLIGVGRGNFTSGDEFRERHVGVDDKPSTSRAGDGSAGTMVVQGATWLGVSGAEELSTVIARGIANRDVSVGNLGPATERSSLILFIRLVQRVPNAYNPTSATAMLMRQPTIISSVLKVVEVAGCERLAMDPETLRLREGPTPSKSLLALSRLASSLAGAATLAAAAQASAEASRASLLTALLAEDIGGPATCAAVLCLVRGDYTGNGAALGLGRSLGRISWCCPTVGETFARMASARLRHMFNGAVDVAAASQTTAMTELQQQQDPNALQDGGGGAGNHQLASSAGGSGNLTNLARRAASMETAADTAARVYELEGLLLQERERVAELVEERRRREQQHGDKEEEEERALKKKEDLLQSLVTSEERRLEVSSALIELQLEHTQLQEELESTRFRLEKRVLELEADSATREANEEVFGERQGGLEVAAHELAEQKQELEAEMARVRDELENELDTVRRALDEADSARRKLETIADERHDAWEDLKRELEEARAETAAIRLRAQDMDLREQKITELDRALSEKTASLLEVRSENESLRSDLTVSSVRLRDTREGFQQRLEGCMKQIGELSRMANIGAVDPTSGLVDKDAFRRAVGDILNEISSDRIEQEKENAEKTERTHDMYTEARRRYRALHGAYRTLRYQTEDLAEKAGLRGVHIVHENDIVDSVAEDLPSDGAIDAHRELGALREKCIRQQQQIMTKRLSNPKGGPRSKERDARGQGRSENVPSGPEAVKLRAENETLRAELDRLHTRHTMTPESKIRRECDVLKGRLREIEDVDKTRAELGYELADVKEKLRKAQAKLESGGSESLEQMQRELRTYISTTGAEMQSEVTRLRAANTEAEERAVQAEEYMSKATVNYQHEIMRLRNIVAKYAPQALKSSNARAQPSKSGYK